MVGSGRSARLLCRYAPLCLHLRRLTSPCFRSLQAVPTGLFMSLRAGNSWFKICKPFNHASIFSSMINWDNKIKCNHSYKIHISWRLSIAIQCKYWTKVLSNCIPTRNRFVGRYNKKITQLIKDLRIKVVNIPRVVSSCLCTRKCTSAS